MHLMPTETEEFLVKCVVDALQRKFYLYSNEGNERIVNCDTIDQFMNVLEVVRSQIDEDTVVYNNPL